MLLAHFRITAAALFFLLSGTGLALLTPAFGSPEQPVRHHALSLIGEPKMPADFKHFDWVNPDAPKGGMLRLGSYGDSFDTLNQFSIQGEKPDGISLLYDTLMDENPDEDSTEYGLIAEWISYPADYSSATFKLRDNAKFNDGQPVTVDDVIFSLKALKAAHPLWKLYYKNVVSAEQTGDREVTFRFDVKNNRELPQIVGQLMYILPKHYWESPDPDGKPRDLSKSTLDVPVGSGPYRIKSFDAGRSITYERVKDYWAKDLPLLRGQWNFDQIRYTYYRDKTPAFEAFKAGQIDLWIETTARDWATKYSELVATGLVRKEEIRVYRPWTMSGFIFNLRRAQFQDPRVRRAFNLAFDFEFTNKVVFNGKYERIGSFFDGGELRSRGLPDGRELEILNEVRDGVPPEVFTTEWKNPVNNMREDYREHTAEAMRLLNEAGWKLDGTLLKNANGATLKAEILMPEAELKDIVQTYVSDLRTLGIDAKIRVIDSTQYQRRYRSRDFDIVIGRLPQSSSPGNEQREFWGSNSADMQGSQNIMGVKSPAVDKLIDRVIFTKDRQDLVAATRALDRVLLWNEIIVPNWEYPYERIAYWDYFGRPQRTPSQTVSATRTWWFDAAKQEAIKAARGGK